MSSFKYFYLSFLILISIPLVDCKSSKSAPKMTLAPGTYLYKSGEQSISIEINADGAFKETIEYQNDPKIFIFEGIWKQEGSSVSFQPFFESINPETGDKIYPPKKSHELITEWKGRVIIMNEHIDYWFSRKR